MTIRPPGPNRQRGGGAPGRQANSGGRGNNAAPKKPPGPKLPEDIASWSDKDFRNATRMRSPKLMDAIAAISDGKQTNSYKVALLSGVLRALAEEPLIPDPPPGANGRRGGAFGQGGSSDGGMGMSPPEDGEGYGRPPAGYGDGEMGEGEEEMGEDYGRPPNLRGGGGSYPDQSSMDFPNSNGLMFASVEGMLLATSLGQFSGGGAAVGGAAGRLQGSGGGMGMSPPGEGEGGGMGMSPPGEGDDNYGTPPGGYPGQGGFPGQGNRRGNEPPPSGVEPTMVVEAVVKSLMVNNSKGAWEVIERILSGAHETGLEASDSNNIVLRQLLANYGGKDHPSHSLLMKALTNPSSLRSDGAAELEEQATTMVTNMAVSAFDSMLGTLELASSDVGGNSQQPANQGGRQGRGQGGRPNLTGGGGGGQGLIGAGGGASAGPPGEGEGGYGAPPGLGGSGGAFAGNRQPVKPAMDIDIQSMSEEELQSAIAFLWSPAFTKQIADRVRTATPGENLGLFALSGALPSTIVRRAQYESLQAHWKDGAEGLISGGLFDSLVRDPGLLVVLKGMPRAEPSRRSFSAGKADADSKQSWLKASGRMVNMLKGRLSELASESGQTRIEGNTPVRLHSGATAEAVFQLEWPKQARDIVDTATPSPTRLHYIRAVESGMTQSGIAKMAEYYRVRSRGKKREIPGGVWFDGSRGTPNGGKVSVDVVITKGSGGGAGPGAGSSFGAPGGGGAGGGSSYVIEIIMVEIPDYKPLAATTALNSNK